MRRRVYLRHSPQDITAVKPFLSRWDSQLIVDLDNPAPTQVSGSDRDFPADSVVTGTAEPSKVVILLIGARTADDAVQMGAVAESLGRGDVIVGIRLTSEARTPEALHAAGCEVLDWDSGDVPEASRRATLGIQRAPSIIEAAKNAAGEDECMRAPTGVIQSDRVPVPE